MNNIIKIKGIAFLFIGLCLSCSSQSPSNLPEILSQSDRLSQLEFNQFKTFEKKMDLAIKSRQGRRIWSFLSEESREWFELRIEDALFLSQSGLNQLEFHDQFVILALRHAKLAGWVNEFEPHKLVRILFSRGPVHQAFVKETRSEVVFEGSQARQGLARSPKVPIYFYQYELSTHKEENQWKLDLQRMLPIISRGLQTIAHKQKMDYPEAIAFILAQSTGKDFGKVIFEPLEG